MTRWEPAVSHRGERHGDSSDEYGWTLWCGSCRSYHGGTYVGCNAFRIDTTERCEAILGEARCDRHADHLEWHTAHSDALDVSWKLHYSDEQARAGE